jgi:aminopeptidase N
MKHPARALVLAVGIALAACSSATDTIETESAQKTPTTATAERSPSTSEVTEDVEASDDPPITAGTSDTGTGTGTGTDVADASSDASESEIPAGSLGDPFVETLGNMGYDVGHYDLDLAWDPERGELDGIASITATATQALPGFHLDFSGLDVEAITVDGKAAEFSRDGLELIVVVDETIENGSEFVVEVAYSGTPDPDAVPDSLTPIPSGWQDRGSYVYVFGQPFSATTYHPGNDHPSDKASYTIDVTAPDDDVVAAVGELVDRSDNGDGTTTWSFEQPDPQATYLTTLVIGPFTVIDAGTTASGVPIRNVIHDDLVDTIAPVLADQAEMIDFFETIFGPYPFVNYGAAVVPDRVGAALETQTLSIFGEDILSLGGFSQRVIAHEAAHQWVGNSVSLERWEDVWLNEGFASYAEALWLDHHQPSFDFRSWIRDITFLGPELARVIHPPAGGDLFSSAVYQRGALTLHALRLEVGDDAFFDIVREWIDRHAGGNATTADFESLVDELTGDDYGEFFDTWLRTQQLPDELDGVSLPG